MLILSRLSLKVESSTILPRSYGIELVKLLHQRLHIELGDEARPTTTFAGILGHCSPSQDFLTFHPDEFYRIHLTGLREDRAKAIASLDLGDKLEFLGTTFNIINREDTITSYEELYHTLVASEPEPPKRMQLQFSTPTAFAQGRTKIPLPLPTLMFRSWLERWNEFSPVYLGGDELVGYLGEYVSLSRHRIQTRSHPIHRGRVTGFTGEITLTTLSRVDPLLASVAHLLVQYSHFSGTGIKTRLGMGKTQSLVIDNEKL